CRRARALPDAHARNARLAPGPADAAARLRGDAAPSKPSTAAIRVDHRRSTGQPWRTRAPPGSAAQVPAATVAADAWAPETGRPALPNHPLGTAPKAGSR